jgi:hypothetical protein
MPQEFEGDLAGSVFWGADLKGTTFRDVDLTGARISHAWFVDVEIDALVDRVVINGVDVTAYVNEHDAWYPLRAMIRPSTVDDMRAAWQAMEAAWAVAITRARALPDQAIDESVNSEWSFVQTVRHMVMAIDKWFTVPVLGERFSPIGLPNTGSLDFPFPGIDLTVRPSAGEALSVLADRYAKVRSFIATVDPRDLDRTIEVLENGPHPLREGLLTVFEEAFWHLRYASRDLDVLSG